MGYQFRRIQSHATNNHSDIADGRGREDIPTSVAKRVGEEPEGSPEYIRIKYFPSALADGLSLRWLTHALQPCTSSNTTPLRWHSYPAFGQS